MLSLRSLSREGWDTQQTHFDRSDSEAEKSPYITEYNKTISKTIKEQTLCPTITMYISYQTNTTQQYT